MRPDRNLPLTVTPAAVADAMALVCTPEAAALAPESLRRIAWMITASQRGMKIRQRHRPATPPGRVG